jgi:heme exporter protein C
MRWKKSKKSKISAVYNIFAFPIIIVPLYSTEDDRLSSPGSGGNAAFGDLKMSSELRPTFYAAMIGWPMIAAWICSLRYRVRLLEKKDLNA